MKSKFFVVFLVISILTVIAFLGCTPNPLLPDLIPANPTGMFGYCNVDDSNNLVVYVKNQGDADASASLVKVQFGLASGSQEFSAPVGPILAGETKPVSFTIPSGCFSPDCVFTITVDSGEGISESNELNNSVNGICIG